MTHQIADYVEQARSDPTTENIQAMWRAVFMLKGWYFLPAEDVEGPNRPTLITIDGHPWLIAFTNVRRLEQFARLHGRDSPDEGVHLLVLDPLESMNKILEYRDQIAGVVFNPSSDESFRAPVEALVEYARHFDVPIDPSEGSDPADRGT